MAFDEYVCAAIEAAAAGIPSAILNKHHPLLNGAPYEAFRREVSLEARRSAGTFFSGSSISHFLATRLRSQLSDDAFVVDPTCGMGDLLLAYAHLLPTRSDLKSTITDWGERLGGVEHRPDLAMMAKARLIVLARMRGGFSEEMIDLEAAFPHVWTGDIFEATEMIGRADGFLFNPPFGKIPTPEANREWSTGQVNASAVFLDHLLRCKKPDAPVGAVLPEVLRCGTNYSKFRRRLVDLGVSGDYTSFGRFDGWTDVDVFCTLISNSVEETLWSSGEAASSTSSTIEKHFEVRVGTVVPHRHEESGPVSPYICAKTTSPWAENFRPVAERAFQGTTFLPPFVVVRRTSSPSDRSRAVGSIVVGDGPVAVENHLVVLLPKDKSLGRCREVLETLRSVATSDFLNTTMRCRHLTAAVVKTIPFAAADD
jgi:hypothetical protein